MKIRKNGRRTPPHFLAFSLFAVVLLLNSKTASAEKCAGTLVYDEPITSAYLDTGEIFEVDDETYHEVTYLGSGRRYKCTSCGRYYYRIDSEWYVSAGGCAVDGHAETYSGGSYQITSQFDKILEYAVPAPLQLQLPSEHYDYTYYCQAEKESSGGTVVIPHVHSYKVSSSTAATCTADGSKIYTCADSSCNDSYTEVISALGHSWYLAGEAAAHQKCSRCGATQGTHSYTSTVEQQKSCTQPEITLDRCSCGYTRTRQTANATGHNSNSRVCNANGTDTLSCSRCGEIVNSNAACVHTILLNFDAITNGGTAVASQYVTIGKAFTLPIATKTGWDFLGWSDSPLAHAGVTGQTTKRTDATFYAIFSKVLKLSCKDASGTKELPATIYNSESSAIVDLPEIAPLEGWEADGWEPVGWTKDGKDYLKAGTSIKLTE